MYKDLFIDFDDTLYDTHGNAQIALHELFVHFGFDQYFPDETVYNTEYWKTNVQLWSQYAKGEIDRDTLIVERFRRPLSIGRNAQGEQMDLSRERILQVSDWFLDCCSTKPGLVDGARELMEYLRQKGYRLHMCSNGFHEVQYKKLRACGLHDFFDTIVLSEDAGANKPSRQFFDYALKMTGADPDSTLMIGDNQSTDIAGAINAGIRTLFFNRYPDEVYTTEKVDYEVHSLKEIMAIL